MPLHGSSAKFVRAIEELGWLVERTQNNHLRARAPFDRAVVVILPASPGRGRSLQNMRAEVRRRYRVAGLEIPPIPKL